MSGLIGFDDYQEAACETAFYPSEGWYADGTLDAQLGQGEAETISSHDPQSLMGLSYLGLKLAGEAGEIAEKIGKAMRDGIDDVAEFERQLIKELGDPLWYISQIAKQLGYDFEHVAAVNINKLRSRAERGTLGGSGDDR